MNSTLKPKPIFIVGAARNGTTNLCNLLTEIPSISGVTSTYHYGTCESRILRNKLYWGDISKFSKFFNFLCKVQYSDYFVSANGEFEHFLKSKPKNYYAFYFELMDEYTKSEGNKFWLTKLDDLFFLYPAHFYDFMNHLEKHYGKNGFEVIWIKRDLKSSLLSYLHMEGSLAKKRQKKINRVFALFLQTVRSANINKSANKYFPNLHKINFEEYKKDSIKTLSQIKFLQNEIEGYIDEKKFEINTSFKNKAKSELNALEKFSISVGKFIAFLNLDRIVILIYEMSRKTRNPLYYRIFMHKYFEQELKKDLESRQAFDLIKTLKL